MPKYFFQQLQRSFDRFLNFYTSQHNGRKLNWLYKLSKVCGCVRIGVGVVWMLVNGSVYTVDGCTCMRV